MLCQSDTLSDIDGLALRMRMPGRPSAWREVHHARSRPRSLGSHGDSVDEHRASEPIADLHVSLLLQALGRREAGVAPESERSVSRAGVSVAARNFASVFLSAGVKR